MPLEETYSAFAPQISKAKAAGFSDEEIQAEMQSRVQEAAKAGFSPDEINAELGTIKRQPITVKDMARTARDSAITGAKAVGRGIMDVGTQIASGPERLLKGTATAEPTTPPKPAVLDKPITEILPQTANTVASLFKRQPPAAPAVPPGIPPTSPRALPVTTEPRATNIKQLFPSTAATIDKLDAAAREAGSFAGAVAKKFLPFPGAIAALSGDKSKQNLSDISNPMPEAVGQAVQTLDKYVPGAANLIEGLLVANPGLTAGAGQMARGAVDMGRGRFAEAIQARRPGNWKATEGEFVEVPGGGLPEGWQPETRALPPPAQRQIAPPLEVQNGKIIARPPRETPPVIEMPAPKEAPKPTPVAEVKPPQLSPAQARERAAGRRAEAEKISAPTEPLSTEFTKEGDEYGRGAIVHPSTKTPGGWQVSAFDKRGFAYDEQFKTRAEAIEFAQQGGMKPSPKEQTKVDQLAKTEEFQKGNDFTKVVEMINRGGDHQALMDAFERGGLEEARRVNQSKSTVPTPETAAPTPQIAEQTAKPAGEGPVEVFHGTNAQFDQFNNDKPAWFYTKDSPYAKEYSGADYPRTVKANLALKNPYVTNDMEDILEAPYSKQFVEELKAKGYDGISSPDFGMFVAFEPQSQAVITKPTSAPQIPPAEQTAKPAAQVGKDVPERIESAAVHVDGQTFTGPLHSDAIAKAEAAGVVRQTPDGYVDAKGRDLYGSAWADQFVTNKGRMIDRLTADREFNISGAENMSKQTPIAPQIPPAEQKAGIVPRGGTAPVPVKKDAPRLTAADTARMYSGLEDMHDAPSLLDVAIDQGIPRDIRRAAGEKLNDKFSEAAQHISESTDVDRLGKIARSGTVDNRIVAVAKGRLKKLKEAPAVEEKVPFDVPEPRDNKIVDSMGQKQFWAKTRKEIEREGIEGVKAIRKDRAEVNKLTGSKGYASWRLRSTNNTLKNDIEHKQQYYKGLLEVHKERVIEALSEGKPVPPEVLKDYPDLAPKPKPLQVKEGQIIKEAPAVGKSELSPRDVEILNTLEDYKTYKTTKPNTIYPDPLDYGITKKEWRDLAKRGLVDDITKHASITGKLQLDMARGIDPFAFLKKPKPTEKTLFDKTPAGEQARIPGTESRTVPQGQLKSKRRQNEGLTDLERASLPEDQPSLVSDRTEAVREMARLRDVKPRPLDKLFKNPPATPEQAATHAAEMKAWSAKYRAAQKAAAETPEPKRHASGSAAPDRPKRIEDIGLKADAETKAKLQAGFVGIPSGEGIKRVLDRDLSARDLTKGIIREHAGELTRERAKLEESLKAEIKLWDSADVKASLNFMDAIETGAAQPTAGSQQLADTLRAALDDRRAKVQALGTGKLQKFIEDYWPHIWEKPGIVGQIMGKRPLAGPASFLKQRTIPTTLEGIEAGLKPVTYNPVKLALLKIHEMDRYIMAQHIKDALIDDGLAKYIPAQSPGPKGWKKLDDRMFTVYGPPSVQAKSFESYDPFVREGLLKTLGNVGGTHNRPYKIPGHPSWLGAAGGGHIDTKFGTDVNVLMHELGHILDDKFGLWDYLTNIPGEDRAAIDARKVVRTELRALADMRYEGGDPSSTFKKYVRKKPEQMANAINAYLYMPERMAEVAPTIKGKLQRFLKAHPETEPIQNLKKSLVDKSATLTRDIPLNGLLIKGNYWAPADAATVFNRYLSPGLRGNWAFDMMQHAGNTLNQAQLGFSAFHLGFTSIDALTSDVSLAIETAAQGKVATPLKALLRAGTLSSPIENALVGNRLIKEYLNPGSYTKFAREAEAVSLAGGRVFQDAFYRNQAIDSFWKAWKEGDYARVGLKTFPAAMEMLSKPVMEYVVPRQKLGVFAKMAHEIIEQGDREKWEPAQFRSEIQKAWDSVDNRMGQVVYDNLFWNKAVKDLGLVSVRSLGWNLGTVRELGGGVKDFITEGARASTGRGFKVTPRMSYVMALPITVGFLGAIYQFLHTGEAPDKIVDYFFPRTGELDTNGEPERVSMPSYMKDLYALKKHPLTTIGHKVNPLLSAAIDMLNNQDFFGTEIRNPKDPLVVQAKDAAKFVADQFTPFSFRNAKQRAASKGNTPAEMVNRENIASTAEGFVGFTPAPASVRKTDAEELAGELIAKRIPTGARTKEQAERAGKIKDLKALFARDKITKDELREKQAAGELRPGDRSKIMADKGVKPIVRMVKRLPIEDALDVWDVSNDKEKALIKRLIRDKRSRALENRTAEERVAIKNRMKSVDNFAGSAPEGRTLEEIGLR